MTQDERDALHRLWAERVADFHASGQPRTAWAAAHGVTVHQLQYWLRKFRTPAEGDMPPAWVACPSPSATGAGATLTVCVGPVEIRVSPNFDPQLLQAVVRALTS